MKKLVLWFVLTMISGLVFAEKCDTGSGYDDRYCANQYYDQQDMRLNYRYKQVMSAMSKADQQAFKKQQIAWIKKKESRCEKAGGDPQTTGYIYRALMCEANITKARADEFETWLNNH